MGKLKRGLVFWAGDVRFIGHFPWITWHKFEPKISFEGMLEGLRHIQAGDIGLHLDADFLSSRVIPGFMSHAWMVTKGAHRFLPAGEKLLVDVGPAEIVEAISEGVVKRHAIWPLYSDYAVILRPIGVTVEETQRAVKKAESLVGLKYDDNFEFDLEEELKELELRTDGTQRLEDRAELDLEQARLGQKYEPKFSCTEVAAFSWWHCRQKLGIRREERYGKKIISPDSFLAGNFEIAWASSSVTVEDAQKQGLHREGVELIKAYLEKKGKAG